jgi:hypothetical protein
MTIIVIEIPNSLDQLLTDKAFLKLKSKVNRRLMELPYSTGNCPPTPLKGYLWFAMHA